MATQLSIGVRRSWLFSRRRLSGTSASLFGLRAYIPEWRQPLMDYRAQFSEYGKTVTNAMH
jgi:hypothetical protein